MMEKGFAEAGCEILNDKELADEFVMLSLRSKGLLLESNEIFNVKDWQSKNNTLISELEEKDYLYKSGNLLKLSPKGYAVCDEILVRFS